MGRFEIYVGKGMNLRTKETGYVFWEKPQRQMIVFGASGSGKSEFLSRLTYEDIVNGFQSFNIDPKGSKSWLETFFKACDKIGKLYDKDGGPIVLALNYPEVSFRFNPLYGLEPHQIAYVIASGLPDSKEPFWWNISYEITLAIAIALKAKGLKQICFGDIYEFLNVAKIEELRRKLLQIYTRRQDELTTQGLTILNQIASYDPQYFPRVNATLRTYLTRLISGKAGKILNVKTDRDLLKERIENGQLRFFAFLNAEKEGQTAYDVARLLFAWLLAVVGEYSREFKTVEPQLRVNVDEATEVGFWEINKAIRLVRERNVAIKLFTQSPSGFKSAFKQNGENIVQDIINNCDCRVVFSINEPTDQEYFANMSGRYQKPKAIVHKSSISLTYTEASLLKPQDLGGLPPGWGYCFMDGEVYMVYSPLVPDRRRVKVIWKEEEEEKLKAEVEVNLKELFDLMVSLLRIREHYTNVLPEEIKDPQLKEFYEKYLGWFEYYADDFERIVRWMDGVKSIPSVVKGKNPLKKISLVDHSIRVAKKAFEVLQSTEDLSQEDKEIAFLASLVHDLGKAVADTGGYEFKDHVEEIKELLDLMGVSPEIADVAVKHHDKETDDKRVLILKSADHSARREEEELIEEDLIKEIKQKLNEEKLWNMLLEMANRDDKYRVFTYRGRLYVLSEFLQNWVGTETNIRPSEEVLCELFGFAPVELTLYLSKSPIMHGRFLRIEYSEKEYALEERKLSSKLFKGFRVVEVENGEDNS